ncbi:MAG: hypothetical protein H6725_16950 [Sandaracinaceae bacterium]|nr:hypothetical protein [Sandaracinaceae bacterium]
MRSVWFGLALSLAVVGCGGDDTSMTVIGGVGDPCERPSQCRSGLMCAPDGVCRPMGGGELGATCQLDLDCADGLRCDAFRRCATEGDGEAGDLCAGSHECQAGFVCQLQGISATCQMAGTQDIGDVCDSVASCLSGLTCTPATPSPLCTSPGPLPANSPPPPPSVGFWAGVTCPEDNGAPRAYFDVPTQSELDGDFYRLPFPNDVRRTATGLDLSTHPTPATALDIDAIDRYLRASEADLDGFSLNPVVFFRFSRAYDWDSTGGAIHFVNVDPASPEFGATHPAAWLNTFGPISKYICQDWLGLRTLHGAPLLPGTTYAVILDTSLLPAAAVGGTFQRSADLDALLGDTRPTDVHLGPAWDRYAPLRAFLASDPNLDTADVLNATVFTTQRDPDLSAFRTAIREGTVPTLSDLTLCDTGVTSPCEDATTGRGACGAADPDFHEIHGHITLPVFQAGTPPYATPADGGAIAYDASGDPVIARTEAVCVAITIPKNATMPVGGWPVLFTGHGTGGSFRDAIDGGRAGEVADAVSGAATVHAATISIDLPMHGSRRGATNEGPETLFFNFVNPRAARDNVIQGAADLMSVLYFLEQGSVALADSPINAAFSFDATRVAMFMHSQGATHAAMMIANEPLARNVVLSGVGGDLTQSLLNKTQPVNIQALLPLALRDIGGDGRLPTGDFHPALALFQMFFDSADPVNVARRLSRSPRPGQVGTHVFMTYGLGDSYSPEATMQAYAIAGGISAVNPTLVTFAVSTVNAPVSANRMVNGESMTIAHRQYQPTAPVDGHFVASQTAEGRTDTQRFILQALAAQTPVIGQ